MDLKAACETLHIACPPQSADVKKAYRQRVLETHPDQNPGKDASEFILVQLAYQICCEYLTMTGAGGEWAAENVAEPEGELNQRIREIERVLEDLIERQLVEFWMKQIDTTLTSLAASITAFGSHHDLQKKLGQTCIALWQQHVQAISQHLRGNVSQMVGKYNAWVEDYLTSAGKARLRQRLERWYNRTSTYALAMLGSVVIVIGSFVVGLMDVFPQFGLTIPLSIAGVVFLGGLIGQIRVLRLEAGLERLNTLPLEMEDFTQRFLNLPFHYQESGTSQEATAGLGMLGGAGIGFAVGGPIGGLIGGALGGLFGSAFGKPLAQHKQEAYDAVVKAMAEEDERLQQVVIEELKKFRIDLISRIRANYRENYQRQLKLLGQAKF